MPVLLCDALMEKMEISSRMSFGVVKNSDFISHIKQSIFLVDKTLLIAEFLGPSTVVPLFSTASDDTPILHGRLSSTLELARKRGCPEEVSAAKLIKTDVETAGHPRTVIVRTRRFGKTFSLSVINDFLKLADSVSSELGGKLIFKQTGIWQKYHNFCEMHFANHPVLLLQGLPRTSLCPVCKSILLGLQRIVVL